MDRDYEALLSRIERLERRNRVLTSLLFLVPVLALVGWQAAPVQDVLRVRRLEVVDGRGVPMVILAPDRGDRGGSITLRDALGERRGWWNVGVDHSSLTMSSETKSGTVNTIGFGVSPAASRLSLISPNGANLSASMEGDSPRVDLWAKNGSVLFGAPWKPANPPSNRRPASPAPRSSGRAAGSP
jgi:hypothetical protein